MYAQQGVPFIRNYDPEEYAGQGQVWDIVQDNKGLMYFAANGVLEYDGVRWRMIEIPGQTTIRSLAIDTATNIIYVGCIGDFGYLKPDTTGNLSYYSLSRFLDPADRQFSNVWKTEVGSQGVFFSCNEGLYRYSPEHNNKSRPDIYLYRDSLEFFLLFKAGDKIFTGQRKKGIVRIIGDELLSLNGNDTIKKNIPWFILPYDDKRFLFGNQTSGLNIYDPEPAEGKQYLQKFPFFDQAGIVRTDSFLFQNQLYEGIRLRNGNYALATILSGVVIVNKKGEIIDHFCQENGLQSQTVHNLFEDRQGGLWAALTYGISRIEIGSSITQWNKMHGIKGSIYNAIRKDGAFYVSSNLGLYLYENDRFCPVNGLTGPDAVQCFALENIRIPGEKEGHLLVAATHGIYEISGKRSRLILPVSTYEIYRSPVNPRVSFTADYNKVISIIYENRRWSVGDTLLSLDGLPSGFSIDRNSALWLVKDNKPFCAVLSADNKKVVDYKDYSKSKSLEDITFNSTKIIDDNVVFLTGKGLWRFIQDEHRFFRDTLIFGGLLKGKELDIVQLEQVNDRQAWLRIRRKNETRIWVIDNDDNKYSIDSVRFLRLPAFDEFRNDGDSLMWVITSNALYQVDIRRKYEYYCKEMALNRSVTIGSDSVLFNGVFFSEQNGTAIRSFRQIEEHIPVIAYNFNNIRFEYSLPSFDNESKNLYSYCLIKNNEAGTWSPWASDARKEYTNLSEGGYIFKVRAKNIYGHASEESVFNFVILPPWYRTFLAYIGYVILFIIILWLVIRFFTNRLRKKNLMLERIVQERTREIREKKEEIELQAEELKVANEELLFRNQEIQQQNAEIAAQRDNLELLTETLKQHNEEISAQRDEIISKRDIVQKQKEQLEKIHGDITDSIAYAQRIQNSALPDISRLEKYVSEYFLFFKPRNVVSGDFYWFAHQEEQTVITAADCTGHGVPGALMSVLGMSLLKEIVVREYFTHPGVVLRKLRRGVIDALKQEEGATEKDGMDMSIICINHSTNRLQFAGANNPVYLIRRKESGNSTGSYELRVESYDYDQDTPFVSIENQDYILYELKADKMPVGIFINMKRFASHEFDFRQGDQIYLFSDGYADQFGGKDGKKFKYKSFKEVLLANCDKTMKEQKSLLEEIFNDWKGDNEQIDDVVVIGLKLY
ncbi:MAG: SpoIIE family protein phosphatase [Bacteroidetes bacterium]|nr:SpoIIE family protein phosphatase [Bacteroidota bacterium]